MILEGNQTWSFLMHLYTIQKQLRHQPSELLDCGKINKTWGFPSKKTINQCVDFSIFTVNQSNIYPSSHNHGSGKWVPPILVSFHLGWFSTSMIMGGRVKQINGIFTQLEVEHPACCMARWKPSPAVFKVFRGLCRGFTMRSVCWVKASKTHGYVFLFQVDIEEGIN